MFMFMLTVVGVGFTKSSIIFVAMFPTEEMTLRMMKKVR